MIRRLFIAITTFCFGRIPTCLGVSCDSIFLWISLNSRPLNLLLVRSHRAQKTSQSVLSKDATTWPGFGLNPDHVIRVVVKTTRLPFRTRRHMDIAKTNLKSKINYEVEIYSCSMGKKTRKKLATYSILYYTIVTTMQGRKYRLVIDNRYYILCFSTIDYRRCFAFNFFYRLSPFL